MKTNTRGIGLMGAAILLVAAFGGLAPAIFGGEPETLAALATGPGDGQVIVEIDAYGSFGYQTFSGGGGDAMYDPQGETGLSSTSWESAVYFRLVVEPPSPFADVGVAVGESLSSFLTTGLVGETPESGLLPDPGFISTTSTTAFSVFSFLGLDFTLEQSVEDLLVDDVRVGSVLIQQYQITNPFTEPIDFNLVRYYEGDLFLGAGAGVPDGGGHIFIESEEFVFETDLAGEPADTTNLVGITACGGSIPELGRYEVNEWPAFPSRIGSDMELGDVVFNDGDDPDEFVDAGEDYDVGIALDNRFEILPGQTVPYVTTTVFGFLAPEAAAGGCAEIIVPMDDTNPPLCSVVDQTPSSLTGLATDNLPSEDVNSNGVLEPEEDLNSNGIIDTDTGIFSVEVAPGSVNLGLDVDPFVPGDGEVGFFIEQANPLFPAVGSIIATDGVGNTCSVGAELGSFDPFGGIVITPSIFLTLSIERPSPDTAGVRCVETTDPENPDFGDLPFTPFDTDVIEIDIVLSEGDGTKTVCCEFIDNSENVSPPVCAEIELETEEVCDGIDNNNNGEIDEGLGSTTCGLGDCEHTVENCVDGQQQTCDPFEGAGDEICDGQDNDCDGAADEELGQISCGTGACANTVPACEEGQPQSCEPGQPERELCDNDIDDDCDGLTDDDDTDDCEPLYVSLESFSAEQTRAGVTLKWRTLSEIDHVGFRLLRARDGNAELQRIGPQIIPAQGSDLSGAEYEYVDRSRRSRGLVYYYLEDIDRFGRITRHGPVLIDGGSKYGAPSRARRAVPRRK